MNKKTLTLTLGGAIASTLMGSAPSIQAGENPFAMSSINTAQQLAAADAKLNEGGCSGSKTQEGKCGQGKCGAAMKSKEGGCSGSKTQEGKCGQGKCGASMKSKEGSCSGTVQK